MSQVVTNILSPELDQQRRNVPSFREALGFWWKLGWISFGGTAAHLAIMHTELVEKKQWIESDHFFHALNHCMLLPGPEAQQLAIYIGWKLHGKLGGLLAGTLFVLPSTAILLCLSLVHVLFGNHLWMANLFYMLKPIVAVLVLRALFQIGRRALTSPLQWCVAIISFLSMSVFHIPLPWIMAIIVAVAIAVAALRLLQKRDGYFVQGQQPKGREFRNMSRRVIGIVSGCAAVGIFPLVLLWLFGKDFPFWIQLSGFFTRTAFVTIGGSYTVLPYVAQVAVTKFTWLSHAEMLDGFAMAETTPGPLIIVVGYVGFMAGFHHFHNSIAMGMIALLITIFYTFLPCFLLVFVGAPWIERANESQSNRLVLKCITAVVVAAILQLTIFLIHGTLVPDESGRIDLWAAVWMASTVLLLQLGHLRKAAKLKWTKARSRVKIQT